MLCACDTEFFYLESLAKKQVAIYPDASDYGYKYTEQEAPKIQQAIRELRKVYENEYEVHYQNELGWAWECRMFIGVERDGEEYRGFRILLRGAYDAKYNVKFLEININPDINPTSGYKR